jgi:hypothetical protein
MKFKEGQKVQLAVNAPSRYPSSRVGEKGVVVDVVDEGDPTDNYYIVKLEDGSKVEAPENVLKALTEGFNKPGARGTIKSKICPKCKGRGTPGLTTTPQESPCKVCKGTGKVWTTVPYPGQKGAYKTNVDTDEITDQVVNAVAKKMAIPGLTDNQKREVMKHARNLPPAKVAHIAKSLTEMIKEAEEQYCPDCKMNVEPENGACPECGNRSLEPALHEEASNWKRFGSNRCRACKRERSVNQDGICKECWQQTNRDDHGTDKDVDEMSSVGGIGGYNSPLGAGYKTDKKGIKNNFKVREMKTLRKLVKEVEKKKIRIDLGSVESSFTSFLEKKSKSGELQKQFGSGYTSARFMLWIKHETEKEGIKVSPEYLNKFGERLTGSAKHDLFVAYSAALKGAGLGIQEDEQF